MGMDRFFDSSLPIDERIDCLLEELTTEEKFGLIATHMDDIGRLGVKGVGLGGEAAHGVQQRNDWEGKGERKDPVPTTSFPQPVGMCASWDRDLLHAAGEITGIEARIIGTENNNEGLSRWAPTVDLLRDPRWGRNEEGYSEDPYLAGEMAGSYVQGMQGDDPEHHLRIASTLKHFYANNTEDGRAHKDSVFDKRNEAELYLDVFRRVIQKAHPEGVMTAYNKINGVPGMLNHEVQTILKDWYGIVHAVSDGHALTLLRIEHHFSDDDADGVAASLKAGVDAMPDDPEMVRDAVKRAFEKGLITEGDLDRSIRNTMRTKLKLGVYDKIPVNPLADVSGEKIGSDYARSVCMSLTKESIVLLENDGTLPLSPKLLPEDILLAGPMGDRWDQDWYCGEPLYRTTIRDGLERETGGRIDFEEGWDRVRITPVCADDEPLGTFYLEDWGEGCFCLRDMNTGMYLSSPFGGGSVKADHESSFEWFPTTVFSIEQLSEGRISLIDWKNRRLVYDAEEGLKSLSSDEAGEKTDNAEGELAKAGRQKLSTDIPKEAVFRMETMLSGKDSVVDKTKDKKVILVSLGNMPLIKAREGKDRTVLSLPGKQEGLLRTILLLPSVKEGRCKVVLLLTANYPYAIGNFRNGVNAVLSFASGSQDLGTAVSATLFGSNAPTGKLTQLWPESERDLPSIDDYDIIGGGRTYRYNVKKPLYPFGYGLSYTTFTYLNLQAEHSPENGISLSVTLQNTGDVESGEVVEVYGIAPESGIKKPKKQLLAFTRVSRIAPGSIRQISFRIDPRDLACYDEEQNEFVTDAGTYTIYVGRSSEDRALTTTVTLPELRFEAPFDR